MTQLEKSTSSLFGKFSVVCGVLSIVLFHFGILVGEGDVRSLPFWMGVSFIILGLFMIPPHEPPAD